MLYKRLAPIKGLNQLAETDFRKNIEASKNRQLIDVREAHEYRNGHIVGAINIPLSQLSNRMGEISADKPVFLYYQSGVRSKQASKQLLKHGYPEVNI